jgi:hypothetical protein
MTGRRTVTLITLLVLVALLAVGGYLGWKALSSPLPGDQDPPEPTCAAGLAKGDVVRSRDVTVSVYNAGTRTGLAGDTQHQLVARGFIAGELGNAPQDVADVAFVRILTTNKADPAAQLVALQFGKGTKVVAAPDLGPGIEVVVGDRFSGLVKAPRKVTVTSDSPAC